MKLTNRQLSVLNRLLNLQFIDNKENIRLKELSDFFEVSEKTVQNDIKCINDYLKERYGVTLRNQHNKGIKVTGKKEDIEKIYEIFQHNILDSYDASASRSDDFRKMMSYIFDSYHYVRIDDLKVFLNTNRRSVSNLLKDLREELALYDISLKTRPHYGMYLYGDEKAIRCCYVDNIYNQIREYQLQNDELLDDNPEKFKNIYHNLFTYIKNKHINLHNTALIKSVILILVSQRRSIRGHEVIFDEKMNAVYQKMQKVIDLSDLNSGLNDNDGKFLEIFLYLNIEYENDDLYAILKNDNDYLINRMIERYALYGISTISNERIIRDDLKNLAAQINLRNVFGIYDNAVDPCVKRIIQKSPLSSAIARIAFSEITAVLNRNPGISVYVRTALTIHSSIRRTPNILKKNSIAVLTPLEKAYGLSLKRRILDRYSNIIKNIEVISLRDLDSLDNYNYLIYSGNYIPDTLDIPIPKLQVDYYFTETDVRNFYEYVVVPSRIYSKAFGKLKSDDYIYEYKYQDIYKLKEFIATFVEDENLKKTVMKYPIDEFSISNDTLSMILFTRNDQDLFSKLIILNRRVYAGKLKFRRVFVYCVRLDGDMIKMKTTEKVMRNMLTISDTDEIVLDKRLDFYDYYVLFKKNRIY